MTGIRDEYGYGILIINREQLDMLQALGAGIRPHRSCGHIGHLAEDLTALLDRFLHVEV